MSELSISVKSFYYRVDTHVRDENNPKTLTILGEKSLDESSNHLRWIKAEVNKNWGESPNHPKQIKAGVNQLTRYTKIEISHIHCLSWLLFTKWQKYTWIYWGWSIFMQKCAPDVIFALIRNPYTFEYILSSKRTITREFVCKPWGRPLTIQWINQF